MSSRIPLPDPGRPTREEIASILNIQLGTVKSRLSRARHQLKEAMKDILETDSD